MRLIYADREDRDSVFGPARPLPDVSGPVAEIIAAVRERGDEALFTYTERFDGVRPAHLRVSEEERKEALRALPPAFVEVLREAADNIRAFHRQQLRQGFVLCPRPGVTVGQKVLPIDSVGLYVPGGSAAYPSSVLMNAIPAQIAGCGRIAMASPPGRDGRIAAPILGAAEILGIGEIYSVGGAQAVAALAYGTQSVPPVCKIVGPGNAYVAEAKRQVFGQAGIDMVAGPSEILIIADASARADWLAADLLSQAEHDPCASAALLTSEEGLARATLAEVERQLALLPRAAIAGESIRRQGRAIITRDIAQALEIANRIAPEHLELCLERPFDWLGQVRNAGSVFLGHHCPEAMGDYFLGCNHTLPTMGTARFSSALSVDDFIKKIQFSYCSREAQEREGEAVALFARQEGLHAHAVSAEIRRKEAAP